jgi:hypothetical protein
MMKYIMALSLLLTGLISCGDNKQISVGNKTTIAVEKMFDAGNVIQGEVVNALFTVENTGDYPLVIGEVKGSCSCTVAEYPDEPIAPGEKGIIKAHVNTDRLQTGVVAKSVRIVANTEPSITELVIKAIVTNK